MSSKKLLVLAIVAFSASMAFACFGDTCGQWKKELLCEKTPLPLTDPPTEWLCVPGNSAGSGTLTYNTAGPKFDFDFIGKRLIPGNYTLIYYPDYAGNPWPRTGIQCLDSGTAIGSIGHASIHLNGKIELNSDLPMAGDVNLAAKIWLVLSADVTCGTPSTMSGWNPTEYLFEKDISQRINYDDTDLLEVVETVDLTTVPGPPATVACTPVGRCISFYPETSAPGGWGNEDGGGAVTAFPGDNDPAGYVILYADKSKPKTVSIRHLDGQTNDSFDVSVLDATGTWVSLGSYPDNGETTETWITTEFSLASVNLAGPNILIKILPTGITTPPWAGFATYGQLAIDKVQLLGTVPCKPGFGFGK
jgi:hypothetical protein